MGRASAFQLLASFYLFQMQPGSWARAKESEDSGSSFCFLTSDFSTFNLQLHHFQTKRGTIRYKLREPMAWLPKSMTKGKDLCMLAHASHRAVVISIEASPSSALIGWLVSIGFLEGILDPVGLQLKRHWPTEQHTCSCIRESKL
jgi:hypothetical protein